MKKNIDHYDIDFFSLLGYLKIEGTRVYMMIIQYLFKNDIFAKIKNNFGKVSHV